MPIAKLSFLTHESVQYLGLYADLHFDRYLGLVLTCILASEFEIA